MQLQALSRAIRMKAALGPPDVIDLVNHSSQQASHTFSAAICRHEHGSGLDQV